jgi:hypothetical protein
VVAVSLLVYGRRLRPAEAYSGMGIKYTVPIIIPPNPRGISIKHNPQSQIEE